MTRLPQIDPSTATGDAAELLDRVQKTLGVTPNMTRAMANSPALLEGYLALSGALGGGVIPAPVRERLALATAEANGCEYCLSAHTYIGATLAHLDSEELDRARDGASIDPHTEALLTLSNAVLAARGAIDDADLDAARKAGVTDVEIGEVVGHIALNVLTNYFNTLSQVDNDWPVVAPRVAV